MSIQNIWSWSEKFQWLERFLLNYLMPLGLTGFLTGMFWMNDRSDYHRLFYILCAMPVSVLLLISPRRLLQGAKNPIFLSFLIFAVYVAISLLWSATDHHLASLLKRPVYVMLLFYLMYLINCESRVNTATILKTSLILAVVCAVFTLFAFYGGHSPRLAGAGALYNPLLTSHVYGVFASLALTLALEEKSRSLWWFISFSVLFILIVETGSRTPLVGLLFVAVWLLVARFNYRTIIVLFSLAIMCGLFFSFYPEMITSRGLSYRPEIWQQAWVQIIEKPWFGYGYDAPMRFSIPGLNRIFTDPHNIEIAVLYCEGLVGLGLWLWLYGVAAVFVWQKRDNTFVLMISAMLIFGFAAGLTEGGSFLPRPKEHWFLIWIPLALLASVYELLEQNRQVN